MSRNSEISDYANRKVAEHEAYMPMGIPIMGPMRRHLYHRFYQQAWREANLEHVQESGRRSYERRKQSPEKMERMRQQNRDWHAKNRGGEKLRERKREDSSKHYHWLKTNQTEKWLKAQKKNSLRHSLRRFDLTMADYEALVEAQGNLCAICGRPETKIKRQQVCRLSIDHDHETGRVRGLLCHSCNSAIGFFGEDPKRLEKALEYLKAQ